MAGHGILFKHDGRVIDDPSKKYGTGGLCPEKVYMLSSTWNAPMEAFVTEGQFFEAKGIDSLLTQTHKANQFPGLSPLPSYICNDSIKNPEPEKYKSEYEKHLNSIF